MKKQYNLVHILLILFIFGLTLLTSAAFLAKYADNHTYTNLAERDNESNLNLFPDYSDIVNDALNQIP